MLFLLDGIWMIVLFLIVVLIYVIVVNKWWVDFLEMVCFILSKMYDIFCWCVCWCYCFLGEFWWWVILFCRILCKKWLKFFVRFWCWLIFGCYGVVCVVYWVWCWKSWRLSMLVNGSLLRLIWMKIWSFLFSFMCVVFCMWWCLWMVS